MHTRHEALLTCLALALSATACIAEEAVPRAQVPAVVLKSVAAQSKGATIKRFVKDTENGQLEYEAEMVVNGHSKDLTLAPDGALLEIEEQVDFNHLPRSVQSGLKARAGRGTITKVESITKKGSLVAYEAQVRMHGRNSEIQVGPSGERLTHQE